MERHQLIYFLNLVRAKNFTRAAEISYVSQPSLSSQIQKLEEELGGQLFVRERNGCKLTKRGEIFLPRAQEIIRHMELSIVDMKELDGLKMGSLKLGCPPTTGTHVLPKIIPSINESFPKIEIKLFEESSPRLSTMLLENMIDLAFVDDAGSHEDLFLTPIFREELFIVCPENHEFAQKTHIDFKDLDQKEFVSLKKGFGFRNIVDTIFSKFDIRPKIVYESSAIETVQALVETGIGLAIIPAMVRKKGNFVYKSFSEKQYRTIYLAEKKIENPEKIIVAMRNFFQFHPNLFLDISKFV